MEDGEKPIKILGINASPRKYGNTFKLLYIAMETAREFGAKIEIVHLYDYDIKPCLGCLSDEQQACRYPCVINDDGRLVLDKILKSDGLIIATPIYWYGPSGHLKNLIDRMTVFENMIFIDGRSWVEGKVAAFIATGSDSGDINTISYLSIVLNSMGFVIPPWALAYHAREGDVLQNRNALLDAANIGKIVVETIKLLRSKREWYDPTLINRSNIRRIIERAHEEALKNREKQYSMRAKQILKLLDKQVNEIKTQ